MATERRIGRRYLSETERASIVRLLDAGASFAEIAANVGRCVNTVSNVARDTGRARSNFGHAPGSDARRQQVLNLLASTNRNYAEIGEMVGYTRGHVRVLAKKLAPELPRRSRVPAARDDMLSELWAAGATIPEIATALSLSRSGVTAAFQRLGLPRRKSGPRPKVLRA